jgi:hypothetical protein
MIEIVEFFIYTLLKFKVWLGVSRAIISFSFKNPKIVLFSDVL